MYFVIFQFAIFWNIDIWSCIMYMPAELRHILVNNFLEHRHLTMYNVLCHISICKFVKFTAVMWKLYWPWGCQPNLVGAILYFSDSVICISLILQSTFLCVLPMKGRLPTSFGWCNVVTIEISKWETSFFYFQFQLSNCCFDIKAAQL